MPAVPDVMSSELDDPKAKQVAEAMAEAGVNPLEAKQEDYFGFDETERHFLPDGLTFVEFKVMTEGDRRKYQAQVRRDVKMQKGTGDIIMKMGAGEDRDALFKSCIVNWNFVRNGTPLPFTPQNFQMWLDKANPRLVDDLDKAIRKANPWLLGEMTVEDIDKEIESLQEMRSVVLEREEGKAGS